MPHDDEIPGTKFEATTKQHKVLWLANVQESSYRQEVSPISAVSTWMNIRIREEASDFCVVDEPESRKWRERGREAHKAKLAGGIRCLPLPSLLPFSLLRLLRVKGG